MAAFLTMISTLHKLFWHSFISLRKVLLVKLTRKKDTQAVLIQSIMIIVAKTQYLSYQGQTIYIQWPIKFNNSISLITKAELLIKSPDCCEWYASVFHDYNSICILQLFFCYSNLARIITHRIFLVQRNWDLLIKLILPRQKCLWSETWLIVVAPWAQ